MEERALQAQNWRQEGVWSVEQPRGKTLCGWGVLGRGQMGQIPGRDWKGRCKIGWGWKELEAHGGFGQRAVGLGGRAGPS